MTNDTELKTTAGRKSRWSGGSRRLVMVSALVGACAVGAGAAEIAQRRQFINFVALAPAPIDTMKAWNSVAIKGQVSEIFGNKFVLQDDSGRALVETGPRDDGGNLVAKSESVTIQGRFEHGFVHAVAIKHADGHTDVVGPPPPPPHPGLMAAFARHPIPGPADR